MGENQNKKKFYTRWWFWVIIILLFILLMNAIGSGKDKNKNNNGNNNAKVTQGADNTQNNQATKPPENNELTRDNSTAVLTELNTGSFIVGTDIPSGRYVISGDGNGNLFIYDEKGMPYVNEILGGGELGVDTVTTDIAEKDKIEISGINKVTFTPAEAKLFEDTLTTGSWVVGIDFPAGRYDVSSEDGNGNFFVYDKSEFPVVNEILGGGDIGVEKVTVNLENGYKITISGMKSVKFVKK